MFYVIVAIGLITFFLLWKKRRNAFEPKSVRGRRVLITGASSGIGEELAYHYARLQAHVMITARREDLLKKVLEKCEQLSSVHGKFYYHVSDMSKYKTESKKLIEECIAKMGGLDTIILNHAFFGVFTIWTGCKEDLDMFDMATEVNYKSYVHVMSHALPHLRKSNFGRIGVIGSVAGKFGWPMISHYSGSKFALDGFFSAFRTELEQAKEKLTVTLSILGYTATNTVTEILQSEFKRFLQFGSGDNLDKAANHVVHTPDDAAFAIMQATEIGQRELYFDKWYAGVHFKMPTCMISLVRIISPHWVVNTSWKPKLFKEYKDSLKTQ